MYSSYGTPTTEDATPPSSPDLMREELGALRRMYAELPFISATLRDLVKRPLQDQIAELSGRLAVLQQS